MLDHRHLLQYFSNVHFGHAWVHLVPRKDGRNVIQHGRVLKEGASLHLQNVLDTSKVHVFAGECIHCVSQKDWFGQQSRMACMKPELLSRKMSMPATSTYWLTGHFPTHRAGTGDHLIPTHHGCLRVPMYMLFVFYAPALDISRIFSTRWLGSRQVWILPAMQCQPAKQQSSVHGQIHNQSESHFQIPCSSTLTIQG